MKKHRGKVATSWIKARFWEKRNFLASLWPIRPPLASAAALRRHTTAVRRVAAFYIASPPHERDSCSSQESSVRSQPPTPLPPGREREREKLDLRSRRGRRKGALGEGLLLFLAAAEEGEGKGRGGEGVGGSFSAFAWRSKLTRHDCSGGEGGKESPPRAVRGKGLEFTGVLTITKI